MASGTQSRYQIAQESFQNMNFWPCAYPKDQSAQKDVKLFYNKKVSITWRHFRKESQPRSSLIPLLSAKRARLLVTRKKKKVSLSLTPLHTVGVYRWAHTEKEHPTIRPGSRLRLLQSQSSSARCPPAKLAPVSRGLPSRARARMVRATGQGFTACSRLRAPPACQPGAPSHSSLPRAGGVSASAGHSPAQVPSENSRGDGTRLKRLPTFWVNLGQSPSFSFLFGKWKNTKCQVTFTSPALSVLIRSSFQVLS